MAQEDKRLKRRVRNSYFVSTVSIAMVLFLLGSVTYLILNALNVTDRLRESVTIYVMLEDELSSEKTAALRKQIDDQEITRQITYVTKEQAAEAFRTETGDDFSEFIDFNPLPDSFEVGLEADATEDKALVTKFVAAVEKMSGVQEVVYQRGVVEQIGQNLGKLNLVLVFFGGALLVISLILLNNTIRMTIAAKKQLINTMKLVGANKGFIMRPLLGSAAMHGVWAGLGASALFLFLVVGMKEGLPEVQLLRDGIPMAIVLGMIVGGVIISLIFTAFAVNITVRK